ncbi:hypothetical protein [Neochlamydia sp. S13]|uniref:hypothetical protein n=1 Tax=Neochlamydia sp. S13 TaxID=1353976 RepID=UPI0005AA1CD8|nr:hypothetical protein [Neochlamydia sp. S13]
MLKILMLRKQCKLGNVVNRKNSYLQAFFVLQMPAESRLKLGIPRDRLQKKAYRLFIKAMAYKALQRRLTNRSLEFFSDLIDGIITCAYDSWKPSA